MRKFEFTLENGQKMTVNPPSVRLYYKKYASAKSDNALFEAMAEICNNNEEKIPVTVDYILDNFTVTDFQRFTTDFQKWINDTKDADPN